MPVVFRHDFEDNSFSTWDTNDGTVSPSIVTSPVYQGSRAARFQVVGQSARLIKNITATQTATVRANIRRASPDLTETLVHLGLHNEFFTRQAFMQFWSSSPLQVRVVGSSDFVDTALGFPAALELDAWEELQLGLDASANPWRVRLWRNGSLALDATYAQAAFNIERVSIGAWIYTTTQDIYFDDVRISNEFAPITDLVGYKRLVGPRQLPTSEESLYRVPDRRRARVRNIHLSNPGASEVDVSLEIGGVLSFERPVAAGDVYAVRRPIAVTLDAGEVISGYTTLSVPGYVGAGSGVERLTTGSATASKTGCTAGDLLVFHLAVNGDTDDWSGWNSLVNCAALDGSTSNLTALYGDNGCQIHVGRVIADGTCSANFSVGASGEDIAARVYEFSGEFTGTTLASVFENGTGQWEGASGTSTSVQDSFVTTNGAARLAVYFVWLRSAQATSDFTGETGGNLTEAAEYIGTTLTLQLQTAEMLSAGTIDGGSYAVASTAWAVIGTAIIPAAPVLVIDGVEEAV